MSRNDGFFPNAPTFRLFPRKISSPTVQNGPFISKVRLVPCRSWGPFECSHGFLWPSAPQRSYRMGLPSSSCPICSTVPSFQGLCATPIFNSLFIFLLFRSFTSSNPTQSRFCARRPFFLQALPTPPPLGLTPPKD